MLREGADPEPLTVIHISGAKGYAGPLVTIEGNRHGPLMTIESGVQVRLSSSSEEGARRRKGPSCTSTTSPWSETRPTLEARS